jgi:hypothetical protein
MRVFNMEGTSMRLKPIRWRKRWLSDKSGSWEEARLWIFTIVAGEDKWAVFSNDDEIKRGRCHSTDNGKRKAEAWLLKKIKEVAE